MAAAINILFRGKYGWGFPVGSFRSCFFVFNGGFTKQPNLLARLLRVDAEEKLSCDLVSLGYRSMPTCTRI